MKIIVVGLRAKGREWLEVASRRRNVEILAVVDGGSKVPKSGLRLPEGTILHDSFEKALEARADAAIIASAPSVRGRHAVQALNAGMGVLIETPIATTLAEARQIFDAARTSNKPVVVAQSWRFGWAQERLRDFVRQGRLGRVTHMSVVDRRRTASEGGWTADAEYVQLLDRGVDQLDGVKSVLGLGAVSLMVQAQKAPWSPYRHGSTTQSMIEMEQGVHVHYFGSLTAARDEHETRLEGEKGVLWTDQKLIWWRKRGWPRFIPLIVTRPRVSPTHTRRLLVEELRSALQRVPTQGAVEQALPTLEIFEAAVRSDRDQRPVRVENLLHQAQG